MLNSSPLLGLTFNRGQIEPSAEIRVRTAEAEVDSVLQNRLRGRGDCAMPERHMTTSPNQYLVI